MSLVTELSAALDSARRATRWFAQGLTDAELSAQPDPEFSPIGWHLGHVAWQEECFALRRIGGQPPIDPALDTLYDTFRSAKTSRGALLPERSVVESYARLVRNRTLDLLHELPSRDLQRTSHLFRFLANHERQHAETIGVVRLLGALFLDASEPPRTGIERTGTPLVAIAGGEAPLGCAHDPDGWDNERARHTTTVGDFQIARQPVTCGDWLAFIDAGGYARDEWWTSDGIAWRQRAGATAPRFWRRGAGSSWWTRDLGGEHPMRADVPVAHVSWHEAQAYCRFRGGRLPTEPEWEKAATWNPCRDHQGRWPWGDRVEPQAAQLGPGRLGPGRVGQHPQGDSPAGIWDLAGGVWEWTAALFAPYPGFVPQEYRGYSEPWFDGQHRVCRGGSYLTQPEIARCTFRNFFLPDMRAIPIGVRLALDS